MSLERLKYGIECNSNDRNSDLSVIWWVVVAVFLVAAVSLGITIAKRSSPLPLAEEVVDVVPESASSATVVSPPVKSAHVLVEAPTVEVDVSQKLSPKIRALLMRLEKASNAGELEMQVSAIEQIRAIGGDDAIQIFDELLPRLGELNYSWLFDRRNPQWVAKVTVKSGDVSSRIAREHGSTLRSLKLLNKDINIDKLAAGSTLYVMDHPRFHLVLNKHNNTLDMYLNGKIFKRYRAESDFADVVLEGTNHIMPANIIEFFKKNKVKLRSADADEINMLVPKGSKFSIRASS